MSDGIFVMTIISHRKKFIFIHITKTAGTSISKTLSPYGDEFPKDTEGGPHSHIFEVKKLVTTSQFDSYFKFCFVRNPWDKMVSFFFHRKQNRQLPDTQNVLFSEWIEKWLDRGRSTWPQLHWIRDYSGEILVDFIGRYENIKSDLENTTKRIGTKSVNLPVINTSKHTDFHCHYTQKAKQKVADKFAIDIDHFGYTFQ